MAARIHFARLLLLLGLISPLLATGAPGQLMDEYQLKAAFLFNFAKFVEWPADAFPGPNDPMPICILGPDPFGGQLENVVKGKSIDGHALVVRRIADIRQAAGCRILFAATPEKKHLSSIFAGIREIGVLTVGEVDETWPTGAAINFTMESGRVRFEVNVEAAEREKVRLSSKLLSLARNVKK